nr:unnamed protein product [Callosobruchus chinensis]
MLYLSMNAVLFSKLSRQEVILPFATIDDIIEKRTHSVCIRNDSFALDSIKDGWKSKTVKEEEVINLNCPDIRDQEKILEAICKDNLVILESRYVMSSLLKKKKITPCRISNAERRYFITGNVYMTHKRFKEVKLIENFIKTLHSAGITKKLEQKWLTTKYVNRHGIINVDIEQVDLRHVRGIYFLYTVLVIVSLILLAAEVIWSKIRPKSEHQLAFVQ